MRSIGIDLEPAVRQGRLRFHAERPTMFGLEMHLVTIHKLVKEFKPRIIIIDPITNFASLGSEAEIKSMLTRLIDFFKMQQITAMFTSLTSGGTFMESTEVGVSSLMDTWMLLRDVENGAERNRVLHLLKSRGMAHSNQVREFLLTNRGVELRDVYLGPAGTLLMGTARLALEAQEKAAAVAQEDERKKLLRDLERKQETVEIQIASLRSAYEAEAAELLKTIDQSNRRVAVLAADRVQMARQRQADESAGTAGGNGRKA
jgi:circadian clock protein KaiC